HEVEVVSLAGNEKDSSIDGSIKQSLGDVTIHRVYWSQALDELNLFLISAPTSHFVLKSGLALWRKFLSLHQANPFDVVEAPEHLAGAIHQSVTKIAPLLVTLHTPHFKFVADNLHSVTASFDNQLICMLERLSLICADVVACPSRDLAGFVAQDTGYALEKIEFIRNPVDTKSFSPKGPQALAKDEERVRVLFVGRLESRKGIQDLIEAIPQILKECSNVEFVIVGADTNTATNQSSMKAFLLERLKKNGCTANVNFISHVELTDMPQYYRCADICVVPSLYDNAPYTCIEALASGKPVVASTAGGAKEYVANEKYGLIVPPGDPQKLARALITLASDKALRESYGRAAREFALAELGLETYVENKIALYKMAIKRYEKNKAARLYMLPPEQSLLDSVELLCAFDRMTFEVLCQQSIEFRLKAWFRLLKKRPKLALLKTLRGLFNSLPAPILQNTLGSRLTGYLDRTISQKEPPPFGFSRQWAQIQDRSGPAATAIANPQTDLAITSAERIKSTDSF
ncbi:MAG: glycosyltransferase family 4 protein, partial [Candidatus Obscuribacterales bacterium]|nr:glycosyltransferase family 4 protein [Candidatus Obscuribacterales bacterium]